jgi:hypothetical protein
LRTRFADRESGTPAYVSILSSTLRLTLKIAERLLSGAAAVARVALEILGEPAGAADRSEPAGAPRARRANGGPPEPEVDVSAPAPGERGPEPDVVEPPGPEAVAPAEPAPADTFEPEPSHVDEEPVLGAEEAEAGAEEGAGAEVHVDEPWEGYATMTAADVRARLADADPEVAAAVQLYEAAHKDRSSVIEAAARRLSA